MTEEKFVWMNHDFIIKYGYIQNIGYEQLVNIANPDLVWIYSTEDDYQGDWFAVGKGERFGQKGFFFCTGSYGSCTGCDFLEGCTSKQQFIEYAEGLKRLEYMGETKEQAIKYLNDKQNNSWTDGKKAIQVLIDELKVKL